MTILSFYVPILLSLSLSFLLHTFKKHIHSFFGLATAFNTINTTKATDNYKLNLKCHHPISSTVTTDVNGFPPSPIGFVDEIGGGVDGFMSCTESLGSESIDVRRVDDQIDEDEDDNYNNNNNDKEDDEDEDDCWRRMRVAEGRGNWREGVKSFPPPLSSFNCNGQPSFNLLAVRKNGRLELTKVRIKRPEILYASRQDGRLRLYLIPDQCIVDDVEEEEYEGEEEEQELVEDVAEQLEEIIVESSSSEEEEEEEEDDKVVEEIRYEKEEGEWKFPMGGNEAFRRCHAVVNQCHHVHGSHHHHHHHHLHIYGVGIA